MTLDWQEYDAFDWARARQSPMPPAERAVISDLVADVLALAPADRGGVWGRPSPPGRFAATVVHVVPGLRHRYHEHAAAAGIAELGVKVFKTTDDATREARRLVALHRGDLRRLPGLPHPRVQRSLDAGARPDGQRRWRAYIVQEWMDGETLEHLLRRHWAVEPADGRMIRSILAQLLGGIIIPLWGAGTVWWDVRDANYCYARATDRPAVLDVDSLAAYADEILATPDHWPRRDKGRRTALARLRQMAVRLVLAQGLRGRARVAASLGAIWDAELEPALTLLGTAPGRTAEAQAALARFLLQSDARGLFVSRGPTAGAP